MARLSIWTRAKHRAGLERPHLFGFQPPKKVFGVTPVRFPPYLGLEVPPVERTVCCAAYNLSDKPS